MKPYPGKFYLKFDGETLKEAIEYHATGFDSIDDAIHEASLDHKLTLFEVYDSKFNLVHSGITKDEV